MTRLILIRHGESEVTVRRVVGGPRSCIGLSDLGRRQAEALRERLAATSEIVPDVLMASTYPRAIETAQIIAPAFGDLSLTLDAAFGEHDPGPECDGLTFDQFVERHGRPDWEADPHAVTFPGGETVAEFHHRVGLATSQVLRTHRDATVVLACHGGVIDAVLRMALRTVSTGGFEVHTLNTSLTELVHVKPGRWRLVRYNDVAHLAGLPAETPRQGA